MAYHKGVKAMKEKQNERFFMVGDAAEILNCCPQTVRNYERSGDLEGMRTVGGRRLYRESDVMRLAEKLRAWKNS